MGPINIIDVLQHRTEEPAIRTIEKAMEEFCDHYCRYPYMPVPEGKTEDWLYEEGSPCSQCPFGKIL